MRQIRSVKPSLEYDMEDDVPTWYKSQYEAAFGKYTTKKEKKKRQKEKDLTILTDMLSGSISNRGLFGI